MWAWFNDGVTDQLVDERRQRANRHTLQRPMLTDWSSPLAISS